MTVEKQYRVLHIFSSYGGGISSLVLNLIENKTENFIFDTMAFSYKNADIFLEHVRKMGGEAYQMPRPRIDGYAKFKNYVGNVITKNEYDAIHCHITGWHAKPFVDAAKKQGIRSFIFHAHTTRYDSRIDRIPFVQMYDKYFNYKHSVAYLTCSDMAAKYIYGEKYLEKRKAFIIPNGMNEELFLEKLSSEQRKAYYQEFDIPNEFTVIGHVGRFSYPKNHSFMLEIVKGLKEKGRKIVLVLVGDGELFSYVIEEAKRKGLFEDVRFLGRRTDVPLLMQFFDCMILPSINEGLPTVAVECQAVGTKMILSDTITRQCDMKLDLLEFLPIDDVTYWVDALERASMKSHLNNFVCLTKIKSLGFTAREAGNLYCGILKEIIENGA